MATYAEKVENTQRYLDRASDTSLRSVIRNYAQLENAAAYAVVEMATQTLAKREQS